MDVSGQLHYSVALLHGISHKTPFRQNTTTHTTDRQTENTIEQLVKLTQYCLLFVFYTCNVLRPINGVQPVNCRIRNGRLCWRQTPTQPQQAQQLSSCVLQLDEPHFIITTDALHMNKCSSLAHVGVAVLNVQQRPPTGLQLTAFFLKLNLRKPYVQWRTEGAGEFGVFKTPPPEILKAFQNRAKLNPIVKTVKNC